MALTPTTYNTGNAVPSNNAKDLDDNARFLDAIATDLTGSAVVDRLGKSRDSVSKLESQYIVSTINGGVWAVGVEITALNQYMSFNGIPYKAKSSQALPYTTVNADATLDAGVEPFNLGLTDQQTESKIKEVTPTLTDIKARNVNDMLAGTPIGQSPITLALGQYWSSGGSTWVYENTTTPISLDNFRLFDTVTVDDFIADPDVTSDYLPAIQAAIDYAASLTGDKWEGSQSFGSRIGDSRTVTLLTKRYPVSGSVVLKNNVALIGNNSSLVAQTGFTAGEPILTTDGERYFSADVSDIILDGNNLNVKGTLIPDILACKWSNIKVLNCQNDGITMTSGADFVLDGFFVSCSETPISNSVAGLKTSGSSDATFTNGICRFSPVGIYVNEGGNNEFANIHCWGGYQDIKQYINVYIRNSYRNTFTNIYADSPTKQDYGLDNTAPVNGFPNGGVCFYLEREGTIASGSQSNQFVNCRPYANYTAYTNAGLSGRNLLFANFDANCFFNQFTNTVKVDGEARLPFLEDPWGFWNNDIQRSTTLFNSEKHQVESLFLGDGTCGLFSDSGTPEGSVTANPGAIYLRKDGGLGASLYIKSSGTDTNTGWVGQGDRTSEGFKLATIAASTPIARITPAGFGVTTVEVDITAAETAAYFGTVSKKFIFTIRTTASTGITTVQIVPDFTILNSNANYAIDAEITTADVGSGAVEVSALITESGALNPTQADIKWSISAESTKVGLQVVPL